MKIPSVGDELFHADGRTDMTITSFREFAKAPKNGVRVLKTNIFDSSFPVKVHGIEGSQICE
jgi:hypothetical protein